MLCYVVQLILAGVPRYETITGTNNVKLGKLYEKVPKCYVRQVIM